MIQQFCFWIYTPNNWKQDLKERGSAGGPVVKNLPANAGDMGLIPSLERSHVPRGN